jgi:hypothetical protein
MKIQTIRERRQIKYVVLPIEFYRDLMNRLEDQSDLKAIEIAGKEPLYDMIKKKRNIPLKNLIVVNTTAEESCSRESYPQHKRGHILISE